MLKVEVGDCGPIEEQEEQIEGETGILHAIGTHPVFPEPFCFTHITLTPEAMLTPTVPTFALTLLSGVEKLKTLWAGSWFSASATVCKYCWTRTSSARGGSPTRCW
jgi:hypothetical protein